MNTDTTEFYGRLFLAVQMSTDGKASSEMSEVKEVAAIMAEDGFRYGLLPNVDGVRLASQAIVRYLVDSGEMTAYDCGLFLPCAVNKLIEAQMQKGSIDPSLAESSKFHLPICGEEACPKSGIARKMRDDDPHLATASRWTEDTACVKARG